MQIALDGGDLSAISSDGQFLIKGVLFYASMDDDGAVSEVKAVTISFQSGTPPAAGQIIRYDFTAQMKRKEQRLALAFYDIAGDNTLATVVPINPQAVTSTTVATEAPRPATGRGAFCGTTRPLP